MGSPPETPSPARKGSPYRWVAYIFTALGVLLLIWAYWFPSYYRSQQTANEAGAHQSVLSINTATMNYMETYNNGYARNLAVLGPPENPGSGPSCKATGMIDGALTSGRKGGYMLEYKPGARFREPSAGCPPGARSYTLTARPIKYGETGSKSFFTDESRTIRWTSEDRPATAKDPPFAP